MEVFLLEPVEEYVLFVLLDFYFYIFFFLAAAGINSCIMNVMVSVTFSPLYCFIEDIEFHFSDDLNIFCSQLLKAMFAQGFSNGSR